MSRRCPSDTVLQSNVCFYNCQGGYETDLQDPFNCVLSTPTAPVGFTKAPNSNSVILKPAPIAPTSGVCPLGYIEWVYGQCYLRCPSPGYADGGTMCIKDGVNREYVSPTCPVLFYLPTNGVDCVLTPFGAALGVLLVVLVSVLFLMVFSTYLRRISMPRIVYKRI